MNTPAALTDEVRAARRAICSHVAKLEADGATAYDIARAFPAMRPHEITAHLKVLCLFGLITDNLGVTRGGDEVFHVQHAGVLKLGLPADAWHSETRATA